jgi:hypothetical protein
MVEMARHAGIAVVEDDYPVPSARERGEQVGVPADELVPQAPEEDERTTAALAVHLVGDLDSVGTNSGHAPAG